MGKGHEHFSNGQVQVANRYIKKCSDSLAIRDIKTKTILRFHKIQVRLAYMEHSITTTAGIDLWRKAP